MVAANRKNIKERRMLVFLHSWATRGMECYHLSHVRAKTHCFERPLSALFPWSWCTAFSKGRVDARTCCLLPLRPVQMGESKTWIAHGWLGKTSSLEGTGASWGQSHWTSSTHPVPVEELPGWTPGSGWGDEPAPKRNGAASPPRKYLPSEEARELERPCPFPLELSNPPWDLRKWAGSPVLDGRLRLGRSPEGRWREGWADRQPRNRFQQLKAFNSYAHIVSPRVESSVAIAGGRDK